MQQGAAAAGPQPPASVEDSFSPMRAARAGRRAGKTVVIAEPLGTELPAPAASGSGRSTEEEVLLSSAPAAQPPRQALDQRQQDATPGSQQQPPPGGPPPKRVGFDLQAREQPAGGGFTGVSRRKAEQLQREELSQAQQRSKYDDKLVEACVPDVLELQDEGKEDISRMVARAPKASAPDVQRVAELELEAAWLPKQPAGGGGDIDLSLLTACLLPSAQVVEPPEPWDPELLFSQLKAELQKGDAGGTSTSGEREEPRQV